MRDVAIAYRIYPKVAESAGGLPGAEEKLQLSELCLRSFKKSLGDLRVKIWVILDNCSEEYQRLFQKYFRSEDLVLVPLAGVGNQETFARQIEVLLQQNESEVVYFAEDDYFYLPGEFRSMINFLLGHKDVDFVSPYDHLHCYTLALHRQPKWLAVHGGKHWRTASSTCLTFLTRRETLQKTADVFRKYTRRSLDCSMWLSLTKRRVLNIPFLVRHSFGEPESVKIIVKSWLYFWRQILFGRKWMLWVPVPAIATHLDVRAMAPGIDWLRLIEREAESFHWALSERTIS